MHLRLHLRDMFQTTTGFLSLENWRRCEGSFPDSLWYRRTSPGSTAPQYSFEIPIILSTLLKISRDRIDEPGDRVTFLKDVHGKARFSYRRFRHRTDAGDPNLRRETKTGAHDL